MSQTRERSEFQLRTGPLVNLTSMAHIVRIDAAELEVEFLKDAVIANSQLEFGSAFKSLVRETS